MHEVIYQISVCQFLIVFADCIALGLNQVYAISPNAQSAEYHVRGRYVTSEDGNAHRTVIHFIAVQLTHIHCTYS